MIKYLSILRARSHRENGQILFVLPTLPTIKPLSSGSYAKKPSQKDGLIIVKLSNYESSEGLRRRKQPVDLCILKKHNGLRVPDLPVLNHG